MRNTERRHSPRLVLKELAYVNLDPGNGGIILDVSEGGFCFQSAIPIRVTKTIRFWFYQGSNRVEASGRLAWKDDTQKRGGLVFTNLPADARKEIRKWISLHAPAPASESGLDLPVASAGLSPSPRQSRRDVAFTSRRAASLPVPSSHRQSQTIFTGFSGGLLAGVFVSALVVGLFFVQTHRRELGESLIHLGERLGGNSSPQQSLASLPRTSSPDLQASLQIQQASWQTNISVPRKEPPVKPPEVPVQSHEIKPPAGNPSSAIPLLPANANILSRPATRSSITTFPPEPSLALASASSSRPDLARAVLPPLESPNQPVVHVEPSNMAGTSSVAEKYLEVGRFNEKQWVDRATGVLSQFGFPVKVIPKNRFWKKSYQVLVGPYDTDQEAEAVHKTLASHGFAPRSFERGSRDFSLPKVFKLGGTSIPVGECIITWESYIPDAIVKFASKNGMAFTFDAQWVSRTDKFDQSEVVYTENRDGSRTLKEIRFAGMRRALVFARGNT
jgi:PilZ domain/SPOR domain